MTKIQAGSSTSTLASRVFSEQLYRIREVHIEVESILQSLAALQDDIPCASCTSVCCKEVMCRESLESDFLRFLLGPVAEGYNDDAGWYVPGSGCRLSYGRPLVCYEFFCEKFESQDWMQPRQLSRALRKVYANAFAGQPMLVVEDISRVTAHKLDIMYGRLENLREMANAALRRSLSERLRKQMGAAQTAFPITGSNGWQR